MSLTSNTKIIIGTAQFGLSYGINNKIGKPDTETVKQILDYAIDHGISFLDTAEAYGDSHEVIGRYHKSSLKKYNVITKFSLARKDLPINLIDRVYKDLDVMNVSSLYAYMFHSFKDFRSYSKFYKEELIKLKKEGYIKKIGVSLYTNQEVAEVLDSDIVDLIQLPFNLLDNNNQRSSVLEMIKGKEMEIHTRSTFLQGLFFKSEKELSMRLKPMIKYIKQVGMIANKNNISLNDLALSYVFGQKIIDKVLIGVDSLEQLKENYQSLKISLSDDMIEEIDQINVKEVELLNPNNWK